MSPAFRFSIFLLALTLAPWTFAQSLLSIRGRVVDATDSTVAGITVRLETTSGALVDEAQSDPSGSFTLLNLHPGDFVLRVPAAAGFAQRSTPLHLSANVTGMALHLALASIDQQITVNSDPGLSTDSSANRDTVTVSGDDLRKLPVFDLDYVGALSSFLDPSAGAATLIVDGVEMKSVGVSPSSIQEVRINNDPYSAEFQRPGRGRIEITTKPGSPEFHGEFNFVFRDAIFNAKNYFAITRPPEARRLFEGHFTGPVGHAGHTTFIASGEYGQRNIAAAVHAIGPNGPIDQNVATPQTNSQASLRVTHDFSPAHRLQVGYNYEADSNINSGVGGLVLPEAGTDGTDREDDLIFNDRILISPNLINQLLLVFEKDEDVTRSVTNARSIQVGSAFTGGGAQADMARTENTLHLSEVVTWNHGRHYIRFGVQLPQFSRRAVDDSSNKLGTLSYASLANYPADPTTSIGTPFSFTAHQGIGRGIYWANQVGSFIQDQITLNPKLQFTLGLRYDWQTYLSDNNNVSPRFSLAYAPGKGKTILRLGSGIFYDRTGGDFPATFKLHNGLVLNSIQLQNPTTEDQLTSSSSTVPSSIVREAANIRAPYTIQSSLGVEHKIGKNLTLTASFRTAVQVKSFRSRDVNAPILPPNPSLTAVYARPNPAFSQIQEVESGGRQLVNALDLSFRGRAGRWFSGQAQYTLSRAEDNTHGIDRFPQDQYNPNAEWGRSNSDHLHALNLMGNINPDHWLSLGVFASFNSGTPYTETTGNDDFHTGFRNARPAGVGRNTLQSKATADLDLQWEHEFKLTQAKDDNAKVLTTGLAAFNVLNHTNYSGYIGALNSPLFQQPTSALPGRQLQFSLGYRF